MLHVSVITFNHVVQELNNTRPSLSKHLRDWFGENTCLAKQFAEDSIVALQCMHEIICRRSWVLGIAALCQSHKFADPVGQMRHIRTMAVVHDAGIVPVGYRLG